MKHRYICLFGGICVLYLLIMTLVGKYVIEGPEIEENETYTVFANIQRMPEIVDEGLPSEESKITGEGLLSEEPEAAGEVLPSEEPEAAGGGQPSEEPEAAKENLSSDASAQKSDLKKEQKPKATENPVFYGYRNVSAERKKVVRMAKKYVGKISYYWGGKPSGEDIEGKTDPNKLDCSGFIQFICSKIKGERVNSVGATISISGLQKISKNELRPGDIGLKLGTGSLYYDADGKAYVEPELAERANEKHVCAAEQRIDKLQEKILMAADRIKEKKEQIRAWREKRQLILKKARKLGRIKVSKSKNLFSIIEIYDEEMEETLEEYRERYRNISLWICHGWKVIETYQGNRVSDRNEIQAQRQIIKKYDREIDRKIDHVGLYCGKDEKGEDVWCHCSSSKHGVVWENTDLFQYYYQYFK